jgi:periplasmic protein TonB
MNTAELREPKIQAQPPNQAALRLLPPPRVEEKIFADVLLEVDGSEKRRRKWAAMSSILFESIFIALALIVPLMFTEALPRQQLLTFLVAPPPPPPPPPPAAAAAPQVVRQIQSDLTDGQLRMPSRIPQKIAMIHEDQAPPVPGGVIGGVPGGIPGGQLGGVIGGIISSTSNLAALPKLAPVVPKRIRISQGVTRGLLLEKVEPKYPSIAAAARIQGVVVLSAVISKTGKIENLELVSGHPMLVPAAIDAVRQWRYRPYLLNGEPVEVETTITVTFQLAG